MKKALKWLIAIVVLAGVVVGLTFAYLAGRKEMAREREREQPVKVPPKVSRAATGDNIVTFDAETQKRAAVVVALATAATFRPEVQAYGKVLDPTPLVMLDGDLLAAEAALTNSAAQRQRTKQLFEADQNASRRALDTAEAQFRADEIRVQVTRNQLNLNWGEGIARLDAAGRAKLIEQLLNRQTVLIRVDVLVGDATLNEPPAQARLSVVGHEEKVFTAPVLSPAPVVNGKVPGQGFFLRLDSNDVALRPGAAIAAFLPLPGEAQTGVTIPRSAVVRFGGRTWVYLQLDSDRFMRREIALMHPSDAGWFNQATIKPGDKLVVDGGQTLLSEELKSQISVGEEADKQ